MNTARLVREGKYQSVLLPEEYFIDDNELYVKRVGRNILLIPKNDPWVSLIESLDKFSEDYMSERFQPVMEKRESI